MVDVDTNMVNKNNNKLGDVDNSMINIINVIDDRHERFNLISRKVTFSVKTVPVGANPLTWALEAIDNVVQDLMRNIPDTDLVLINVTNK
jgi:hypothetical protein